MDRESELKRTTGRGVTRTRNKLESRLMLPLNNSPKITPLYP
jgi:hypothetical protein